MAARANALFKDKGIELHAIIYATPAAVDSLHKVISSLLNVVLLTLRTVTLKVVKHTQAMCWNELRAPACLTWGNHYHVHLFRSVLGRHPSIGTETSSHGSIRHEFEPLGAQTPEVLA